MTNPALLHQYLDADLISVQSAITSRKKLLQEMARLLTLPLEEAREKDIYHYLLEREKLGNTGIGHGVALPHSRCTQANEAVIAIITLPEPIDYDSPDRQPVDIAFGLLVPQSATQEHLGLLAAIAGIMSDEKNRQALLAASDSSEVMELFRQWSTGAG